MKKNTSSLWQITFPICILGLAALGLLTAMYLTDGSYAFRLDVAKDGLTIETEIVKREIMRSKKLPAGGRNLGLEE